MCRCICNLNVLAYRQSWIFLCRIKNFCDYIFLVAVTAERPRCSSYKKKVRPHFNSTVHFSPLKTLPKIRWMSSLARLLQFSGLNLLKRSFLWLSKCRFYLFSRHINTRLLFLIRIIKNWIGLKSTTSRVRFDNESTILHTSAMFVLNGRRVCQY